MLFPTSLVGSYPQPDWLIDRARLAGRFPPRVRAKELWRVAPEYLEQAQRDATVLAALDGKTIILGVLDLGDPAVETPDTVVDRVRRALPYVPASRLVLAPDCGMKYLPRDAAAGKLAAMTTAATLLRAELGPLR
jgi:methionine synthase II (cobalamin-independent)